MSSLAAAKADNFYFPPDFDPKKHESLNKYHGQHALRKRAAKIDQGILVIRFEVPFNIWCDKCGEHIAKGERFNAEKKAIGSYHSTKVLQFSMSHHCGCKITIQTDPKNAEYIVVEGARKKEESYSAADAEVIELPDEAERERRRTDPLYRLEYQQGAQVKALTEAERLAAIQDIADARTADPYSLNRAARATLRAAKRAAGAADSERRALGLPDEVALLPASETDGLAARVAFLTSAAKAEAGEEARRRQIMEQDIFVGRKPGAGPGTGQGRESVLGDGVADGGVRLRAPAAKRQAVQAAGAKGVMPISAPSRPGSSAAAAVAAAAGPSHASTSQRTQPAQPPVVTVTGSSNGRGSAGGGSNGGTAAAQPPAPSGSNGGSASGAGGSSSSRPPPGAAALAAAAAARAAGGSGCGPCRPPAPPRPSGGQLLSSAGRTGAGAALNVASAGGVGVSLLGGVGAGRGGAGAGVVGGAKRSLKERAAALQKRRLGPMGAGLL